MDAAGNGSSDMVLGLSDHHSRSKGHQVEAGGVRMENKPRVKIRHRRGQYFLSVGSETVQIKGCTVKTVSNGEMLLVVRFQGSADEFELSSGEQE